MNIHRKIAVADGMTIPEYRAFLRSRPDEERWELIEGVPVLNPSPVNVHQHVCSNLVFVLRTHKERSRAGWHVTLGVGTHVPVSPNSLPVPDVYVHEGPPHFGHETKDALVVFEVLSKSNRPKDRSWRQRVYTSIPNCLHYLTVSIKRAELAASYRATGWKERKIAGLDGALQLPGIGVTLKLADVYRYTPVA